MEKMLEGSLIISLIAFSYTYNLPVIAVGASIYSFFIITKYKKNSKESINLLSAFIEHPSISMDKIKVRNSNFSYKYIALLRDLSLKIGNFIDSQNEIQRVNEKENTSYGKVFHKCLVENLDALVVAYGEMENGRLSIKELATNGDMGIVDASDLEKNLSYIYNSNKNSKSYDVSNLACSIFSKCNIGQICRFDINWSSDLGIQKGSLWVLYKKGNIVSMEKLLLAKQEANKLKYVIEEDNRLGKLHNKVVKSRKKNIEKNKFIRGLSHDLRSPINNLNAVLTCLKEDSDSNEESSKLINLGKSNLSILKELVEDLLDISKFKSGHLKLNKEETSLVSIVKSVEKAFSFDAELKNLELKLNIEDKNSIVKIDPLQIKRVISNLVANAIKYTFTGYVEIGIRSLENGSIQIYVKDTGSGLSEEQIQKIYIPFQRFSDEDISGIGLGLSVSKMLVEEHGTKIKITSELGKGSVFSVDFQAENELLNAA